MRIDVLTCFPEMIQSVIGESMVKRAQDKDLVHIHVRNIRDYSTDRHQKTDDYPFGGGDGMVMTPQPLYDAVQDALSASPDGAKAKVIFPTPDGQLFTQCHAENWSSESHLIFICGHYKGIDQRIRDRLVDEEISVGDYVLTGGEIPSMLMMDAVIRLIPGVLSEINSALTDSFSHPLLDCPWYTRPEEFNGDRVPAVLMSGHHAKVDQWRDEKRKEKTRERRPDMWKAYQDKGDHIDG